MRAPPLFANDRWIPASFVLFFVMLACIEGALIAISVRSFTGLSEADPYRRGLAYNDTIAARDKDLALGWSIVIGYERTGPRSGLLSITARGHDHGPLKGATIDATATRIGKVVDTLAVDLSLASESTAAGIITFPHPGRWFVRAVITRGGNTSERFREIFVEAE
ncbi:MAG: FixH family protein [Hyphomicrobium sp.]|jgi:nitrogen fixation protein FixH